MVPTIGTYLELCYIKKFSANKCHHFEGMKRALWRLVVISNSLKGFTSVFYGQVIFAIKLGWKYRWSLLLGFGIWSPWNQELITQQRRAQPQFSSRMSTKPKIKPCAGTVGGLFNALLSIISNFNFLNTL